MTERRLPVRVAIVGGGPSGLMAGAAAARAGAAVTLFEKQPRTGVKLLATGGGRCNLTNTLSNIEFLARFESRQARFIKPALLAFDSVALRSFFQALRLPTRAVDGFHVFPECESAAAVERALRAEAEWASVRVLTGVPVESLWLEEGGSRGRVLRGVMTPAGRFEADRVILAAGGRAWPALGACGDGCRLAEQAGHGVIPPLPALVSLITKEDWPGRCAGITIPDAEVALEGRGGGRLTARGPLLFTHRGISGPAALDISGDVAALLAAGKEAALRLALAVSGGGAGAESRPPDWIRAVEGWRGAHDGNKLVRKLIAEHVPEALADVFRALAGVERDARLCRLTRAQARGLAECLGGVRVSIAATEGFEKAMVTRGGVALDGVNSKTLESRLVPGLFFAGEVLDIDGPCGGFNLQWAFSSGRLAGVSAANLPDSSRG